MRRAGTKKRRSRKASPFLLVMGRQSLKLELQGELEITLQVRTAKGSISNTAGVGCRVSRVSDKSVRLIQVYMIEYIHRLDAELQFFGFGDQNFLNSEASVLQYFGPLSWFLLRLPKVPAAGREKAAGLKN